MSVAPWQASWFVPVSIIVITGQSAWGMPSDSSDTGVAVFRQDAQHVAVKDGLSIGHQPGHGEAETDQRAIAVSAENLAADATDHHEESRGQQVAIGKAPDTLLDFDGLFKFDQRGERPDFAHGVAFAPLASCHSVSISARLESSSFLPRSANLRSM